MSVKYLLLLLSAMLSVTLYGSAFAAQQTSPGKLERRRLTVPVPENSGTPLLYPIDFQLNLTADYRIPPKRESTLRIIGTPNDLYSGALLLALPRTWRPGGTQMTCSTLLGDKAAIPAANIRLLEAILPALNPANQLRSAMLIAPECDAWRAGETIPLIYSIDIPRGTPSGLYRGNVVFGTVKLTIELQVMPFELPKNTESAGFYLPGHFYREKNKEKGRYGNFAFPQWRQENIGTYFRFCVSRRINSASFYHIYPEYDENGKADFSELSALAGAMRQSNADGVMMLELRHMTWYANTVAIRRAGGNTSRVHGYEGTPAVKFHPGAPAVFAEILQQLLDTAKRENWPRLLIATEEELSNSPGKAAGYDTFLPVLKKLCPSSTLIVDNQIGYNRAVELDRGHRDAVPTRQYNSWTAKALNDARRDGAVVGSFNFDLHRMSFGLLQLKLGSQLHHQWADQWLDVPGKMNWRYLVLTPQGVISSWEFERLHAGRIDLAAADLLRGEITRLRTGGEKNRAEKLEKVLTEVTADIPTGGPRYRDWQSGMTAHELDMRRAKIFRAICEARDSSVKFAAAPGRPQAMLLGQANDRKQSVNSTLAVKFSEKMHLDARHDEKAYVGTGAIPYVLDQENNIKARCSTAQEFAKFAPSYSAGFAAYTRDGLYFAAEGNHWQPKEAYRCKHISDSPDMWEDDTCQFFWYEPKHEAVWQLLVNLKGERTLLRNGKVVRDDAVKAVARSPINGSGGTAMELFVPWRTLGLSAMPAAGTEWAFNYAREFHSWRQLTSFGRVHSQFAERTAWGKLRFTGETATQHFTSLEIPPVYRGANRLSGRIGGNTPMTLRISAPNGNILAQKAVSPNQTFTLDFVIGDEREVTLTLLAGERVAETLRTPVEKDDQTILRHDRNNRIIAGETLILELQTKGASLERPRLELVLSSGNRKIVLPQLRPESHGTWKIGLNTAGLTPGVWQVTPRLYGQKSGVTFQVEVLPDFRSVK